GCAAKRGTSVEEPAAADCHVSQNGGLFRMSTWECLGNVVSDHRYLSEVEVLDSENPFVQLVSGVVWLILNGSIYINESQATECDETLETGSFSKYNVILARTAVGHDRKGQLVLFHKDGQTEQRSINLWEMAEFLLKQDVVNAINLDGGDCHLCAQWEFGQSHPSNRCQDNMWHCPRNVSTVVCVHEPRCQPPDCHGHRTYIAGHCQYTGGFWQGAGCGKLDCGPSNCSGHGLCTETGCHCEAGWMGTNCHEECPLGWHGPSCQRPCDCDNQCPTGNCSISPVKQCLQPSETTMSAGELSFFTGTAWLALTLALVLLLLVSTVASVALLLGSRAERQRRLDGDYMYHLLREMNGELLATEKEQPGGSCNRFKD
uniref:EGF-like domain-containing protein n=1 Tax=Otolemur garnettii TaxID=30611 RepID=H0XVN4_OTOGA